MTSWLKWLLVKHWPFDFKPGIEESVCMYILVCTCVCVCTYPSYETDALLKKKELKFGG